MPGRQVFSGNGFTVVCSKTVSRLTAKIAGIEQV